MSHASTPVQAIDAGFRVPLSLDSLIEANLNHIGRAQHLVTFPRARSAPSEYIHCSLNLGFRTPLKPLPRLPRASYVSPASTRLCRRNIFWCIFSEPLRSLEGPLRGYKP